MLALPTENRRRETERAMAMELSLDLCLAYVPKTVSDFLTEVSGVPDTSEKIVRLQGYVTRLEDEMKKIDAFKRELPLCMLLLNDAIVRLKGEAMQCTDSRNRAVTEEFLPLKGNSCEDDERKEKKWMSSALLFGCSDTSCEIKKLGSVLDLNLISEKENRSPTEKPNQPCGYRNRGGGGFVPFKTTVTNVPALCLATPLPELDEKSIIIGGSGSAEKPKFQRKPQQPEAVRKQRRCWSPELHRRFVDALQRLGGWKAATPKQIREIMQVDGLTNDEVKSHLQKYRLHIRKLPGSLTCRSWTDGEVCEEVNMNNSQSGSPQGPLLGGMSTKAISSNGDDSAEDDKSECHSWKGSGPNINIDNNNQSHQPGQVNV